MVTSLVLQELQIMSPGKQLSRRWLLQAWIIILIHLQLYTQLQFNIVLVARDSIKLKCQGIATSSSYTLTFRNRGQLLDCRLPGWQFSLSWTLYRAQQLVIAIAIIMCFYRFEGCNGLSCTYSQSFSSSQRALGTLRIMVLGSRRMQCTEDTRQTLYIKSCIAFTQCQRSMAAGLSCS